MTVQRLVGRYSGGAIVQGRNDLAGRIGLGDEMNPGGHLRGPGNEAP